MILEMKNVEDYPRMHIQWTSNDEQRRIYHRSGEFRLQCIDRIVIHSLFESVRGKGICIGTAVQVGSKLTLGSGTLYPFRPPLRLNPSRTASSKTTVYKRLGDADIKGVSVRER
jgi:hypothetical protein